MKKIIATLALVIFCLGMFFLMQEKQHIHSHYEPCQLRTDRDLSAGTKVHYFTFDMEFPSGSQPVFKDAIPCQQSSSFDGKTLSKDMKKGQVLMYDNLNK